MSSAFRIRPGALAVMVICASATAAGRAAGPIIVEDGQARAAIVAVPELPGESDTDVALELQRYLRQITGVTVPIHRGGGRPDQFQNTIVVGRFHPITQELLASQTDPPDLGADGLLIRTSEHQVVLTGNGWYGPFYAVYAWLEALGCRFYSFAEGGEIIPNRPALSAPDLNLASRPRFAYRDFWANGWVKHSLSDEEYARWRSWQIKLRQGGRFLFMSHNFAGFCPPERYFAEHPEYFALAGGKRVPDGQLCLSNPAVQKLAVDTARRYLAGNRAIGSYSLVSNDCGGWCRCEQCRKLGASQEEQYARFVGIVAGELARSNPDDAVTFMPEYPNVPNGRPAGVTLPENVVAVNVNYLAQYSGLDQAGASAEGTAWLSRLRGWEGVLRRQVIYEWITYSMDGLPAPQWNVIGQRMRAYGQVPGIWGYSGEVIGLCPETELSIYIGSRMLWDATGDPGQIIDEYFRLSYGRAAAEARRYFDGLAEVVPAGKHGSLDTEDPSFWTPERLAVLRRLLDKADAVADPSCRPRIGRLAAYQDVLEAVVAARRAILAAGQRPGQMDAARVAVDNLDRATARHAGLTIINRQAVMARYRSSLNGLTRRK